MIKKLSLILLSSITLVCLYNKPVTAQVKMIDPDITNTQISKLTEEQKELLRQKKQSLKKKYLENWKDKTVEDKKKSLQAYKEELDQFCKKEFGVDYHELKEKYQYYFRRFLPE